MSLDIEMIQNEATSATFAHSFGNHNSTVTVTAILKFAKNSNLCHSA